MKIVFFGYGSLGATVLRGIVAHHDVCLVVTHRSSFSGLHEPDMIQAAETHNIPVIYSVSAAEEGVHDQVRGAAPEVILSTNWRTRLPTNILAIPALGALNVHDALLPRYAGFGAVNWAIRNGESETGVTVHFMDAELDTGAIITQQVVKIGPRDTAAMVLADLVAQYVPATLRALDLVRTGHRGLAQDLSAGSFFHRIGEQDTKIDWSLDTTRLYNLIRAQSNPFVNAWTTYDEQRLEVLAAAIPLRAYRGTPGRLIRAVEDGVAIACGRSDDPDSRGLILLRVRAGDQSPMAATEFFRSFGGYLR